MADAPKDPKSSDKDKGREDEEPTFAEERMSNKDLAARLRDVEHQLATTRAGLPLSLIPEHGAGPGMEVNETWSQAEQEVLSVTVPEH